MAVTPVRSNGEDPHWFRRSVFYEILVRGFYDANDVVVKTEGIVRRPSRRLVFLQAICSRRGTQLLWPARIIEFWRHALLARKPFTFVVHGHITLPQMKPP